MCPCGNLYFEISLFFFGDYLIFCSLILARLMSWGGYVILLCFNLPDVLFLPISGLIGTNMKTRVDKSICPWWNGPCLFEALDTVVVPPRDPKAPFR